MTAAMNHMHRYILAALMLMAVLLPAGAQDKVAPLAAEPADTISADSLINTIAEAVAGAAADAGGKGLEHRYLWHPAPRL